MQMRERILRRAGCPDRDGCTYNLFRRKEQPELCCAVPEDQAVPSFLNRDWEFATKLARAGDAPRGFREHAARAAVRFNGFYVFQLH